MSPIQGFRSRYHGGPPLTRAWGYWLLTMSMGASLLSWPAEGLALWIVPVFAWSAVCIGAGLRLVSKHLVSRGLVLLAVAAALRSVALGLPPNNSTGAGSGLFASFTWAMLCIAFFMASVSVKSRGFQSKEDSALGDGGPHP